MGLLDRLKGKSDGAIEVVVEPTAAGPGDEILVRLDVKEELDDKAQEVRAGITCTGRYLVKERKRDHDGDMQTQTVWRTTEIHEEIHQLQLTAGQQVATFIIPHEAQPASEDAVEWMAWARVDRARGLDVVERVPLNVRVPKDRIDARRAADATNDGLTLSNIPGVAAEGDTIDGILNVTLAEDMKCNAVSIRLHRRCTYVAEAINDYSIYHGDVFGGLFFGSNKSKIVRDEQVAEVDLAGKQEFAAGATQQFPFQIVVPAAGPTSSHRFAQVDWRLEAVLDRRLRDDKSVDSPLVVV